MSHQILEMRRSAITGGHIVNRTYSTHKKLPVYVYLFLQTSLVLFPNPYLVVNRTYGTDKKLCVCPFLLTMFGPVYYGPP